MRLTPTLLLVTLIGCQREMPEICKETPPEESQNYDRWLADRKAADCERRLDALRNDS